MDLALEETALLTGDEAIVAEAQQRFRYTLEFENYARERWMQDYKFVHADNTNGYQWPDKIRIERDKEAKPWLTINKTRQHCLIIENDFKKNRPSMKARPTGGEASYKSGQAYDCIFRGIEYTSRAGEAYATACGHMVKGGWGYFRIITKYTAFDSDEQQIYIVPVNDPLSVLLDPNIKQMDGSDADYCIIFQDYPMFEFKKAYPEFKRQPPSVAALTADPMQSWFMDETVRVAEYMRRKHVRDTLMVYSLNGKKVSFLKSQIPADLIDKLSAETPIMQRPTERIEIEWFLIVGDQIHQRQTYPGRYIPVMRCVAEEYIIDNRLDRPGHVRALRDPQRMYNFWATSATELYALQTKTPWVGPKEAIEGQVDLWAKSNLENPAYLPYNSYMEDGVTPIQKPERVVPPQPSPAYLQGMQQAMQDMTFVSGQYSAMMGEPSNERSGKAINARTAQGDTATYHYVDGMARAIRYGCIVIMDMIPHVMDTKRVIFAMKPDGAGLNLTIDPMADKHFQEDAAAAGAVMNPKLGVYEAQADVGPDWGTKREETFNALTLILTQAPQFAASIGDLLFKSADFDLAEEAAERLRRAVPPHLLGKGPSPMEQELQKQLQASAGEAAILKAETVKTMEENAKLRVILQGLKQGKGIDEYKAETDRLKLLEPLMQQKDLQDLVQNLVQEAMKTHQEQLQQQGQSNDPSLSGASGPQTPQAPVQTAGLLPPADNGNSQGNSGGIS